MSAREKLGLIGLLNCINPKTVIEFGYHRGGATKWLSKFANKVITVDVNEFVSEASINHPNVEPWNCTTNEAINWISTNSLSFDLAIVDADHSRRAVAQDIKGILPYSDIVLMHDSFNPQCRQGMIDALEAQNSHSYYLDFIPSILKADGLWGGLAIAWKSHKPEEVDEFSGEISSFNAISRQNVFHVSSKISNLKFHTVKTVNNLKANLQILFGKYLRR